MLLAQFDWTNNSIRNQEPLIKKIKKKKKNVWVKTTHQYININLVKILVWAIKIVEWPSSSETLVLVEYESSSVILNFV